jgi:hypothetical protein
MVKDMIQWRPIIIGIIIALILDAISLISSQLIDPAFLLAGIAVGFMVGGTWKNGVINGVIFGVIGAIISVVALLSLFSAQYGSAVLGYLTSTLVTIFIIEIVLAIVGGALGYFIKAEVDKGSVQEIQE